MKNSTLLAAIIILLSFSSFAQNGLLTINTSNNITLPGGNYIVKDPLYDEGALTDIGIVSLYDGATNALISTLKGANNGDKVGNDGVVILSDNSFLVISLTKLTLMKNSLHQQITLNSSNSIAIENTYNISRSLEFNELINGNIILHYYNKEGDGSGYYSFNLYGALIQTNGVLIDNSKKIMLYDYSDYLRLDNQPSYIVESIFNNGNFTLCSKYPGLTKIALFDGTNGIKLGEIETKFRVDDWFNPYQNLKGRCIISNFYYGPYKVDENLFKVPIQSCPLSFPAIRVSVEDIDPIVTLYYNSTQILAGGEPFLRVEPSGTNPVLTNMFSAKVWLNEPNAIVNGGKTYLSRHFEITPTDNTAVKTGFVKLYFTQTEFDSYNSLSSNQLKLPTGPNDTAGKHNLQIVKYAGASSTNYGLPDSYAGSQTIINPIDTDIIWNGSMWEVGFEVTGFSGFFVSTEFEMPLPLTLESFEVKQSENQNKLIWKTLNEQNSDSFEIEKSTDAQKFEKIGVVNATNSVERQTYEFIDNNIYSGKIAYYKMKIKDFDGKIEYSKIISAINIFDEALVSPNPVSNKLKVFLKNDKDLNSQCYLMSSTGQIIRNILINKPIFDIDTEVLPSGTYFLKFSNSGVLKFIKY